MKKTLAVMTLLAGAVSGYSQGQVAMGDYNNTDFQITVWSPQVASPGMELTGNSPAGFGVGVGAEGSDIPAGTQSGYTGVPLGGSATGGPSSTDYGNGNLWSIELYAGAGTLSSFSQLSEVANTSSTFFTDPSVIGYAGLWNANVNTAGTITGVGNGSPATLAIAAWYNGGGMYTTYAAAVAASQPAGVSTLGTENVNGSPNTPPDLPGPGNPGVVGGITSFSITTSIPEPSTIALGVIGASAFLMRLRRK
jgi:hypothetical protein